jgi:hypothetical protein
VGRLRQDRPALYASFGAYTSFGTYSGHAALHGHLYMNQL